MTAEQKAAYVQAQMAAMLVEMESMKALNQMRMDRGHTIAYGEEAFLELIDKYGMGHNAVVSFFADYPPQGRRSDDRKRTDRSSG